MFCAGSHMFLPNEIVTNAPTSHPLKSIYPVASAGYQLIIKVVSSSVIVQITIMHTKHLLVFILGFLVTLSTALPGGKSGHVHHRIHVPTKVKTVYITKFIKIPEHHHYFHEKEKQIVVDHHDLHKDHDHDLPFRGHDLGQHKNLFHSPRSHHSFKGYFY